MQVNKGENKFCGPAVLSILTGLSTDEAAREIQKTTGIYAREVRGVQLTDLVKTIERQELRVEKFPALSGASLYRTCYFVYSNPGVYMVELPRHVVAVEVTQDKQIYFCDNHTRESINIEASARLGQKVQNVYKIKIHPKFRTLTSSRDCTCPHCNDRHKIIKYYRYLELRYIENANAA